MINIEEGKYYPFKILGIVNGVDREKFIKLADPNGIKYLLKAMWYEKYDLKPGETITCHIAKINCSGRIFIEPEHPFYKPNNIYDFEIVEYVNGDDVKSFFVKDVFGNRIEIPEDDIQKGVAVGDTIACKVLTIKKGKPVLVPVSAEPDYSGLTVGEYYEFKVSGLKRYSGKYSFFILVDEKGNRYPLRKKFYENYGIKAGDILKCKLQRAGAELYLEPEHPYYQKGKEYDFFIIGEDFIYKYPDGKEEAIVLLNDYGKEIFISRNSISPEKLTSNRISCIVKDIVKGQLVLDCY